MKKENLSLRELHDELQVVGYRFEEIADLLEREQRVRNEKEEVEYSVLCQRKQALETKIQAAAIQYKEKNPYAAEDAVKMIRENAAAGRKSEITLVRDIMMVSDVNSGGVIPLNIQDILKPLEEGFILNKVGLPMPTGLVGDFVWPIYEMAEASLADEGAELSDTKFPFSKLTASPERMGIAIPVTNQALNQSSGVLEMVVREIMPKAILQLLNKIVFGMTKVNSTTTLVGPFVNKASEAITLSSTPTFAELNQKVKAKLLEKGIDGSSLCWVMTKSMEAILEGTPINSNGIFVPMIQNHMLCGLPVYTTNTIRTTAKSYMKYPSSGTTWESYTLTDSDTITYKVSGDSTAHALANISGATSGQIAEVSVLTEYIGLGDWRYQPMGLFGSIRFIVDPYSKARKDSVDFVLNANYATKTIRPEAFSVGKVSVAS